MKIAKTTLVAAMLMAMIFGAAAFAPAAVSSTDDNWQVIKNAVKEGDRPEHVRGEARWFKILITDRRSKEDEVRITLPLSLVEGLLELASAADEHHHFKCGDRDLDLDVKEVLKQLKKAGPLSLIEIRDNDELIKIWIE